MNSVTVTFTLTEASLVLSGLRHLSGSFNMPQLEAVIDNLHAAYLAAEGHESDEDRESEPFDGFRTDAEADANALASAGWGTDEDYVPAEDAGLDGYWESQTELPEYDF